MNDQSLNPLRKGETVFEAPSGHTSPFASEAVQDEAASWFEVAPFACLRVASDGLILAANERSQRLMRSPADLEGRRLSDLFDGPEAVRGPGKGWPPLICLPMKAPLGRLTAVPKQRHFRYVSAHPIVGGPSSGNFYLHIWPAPSEDLQVCAPATASKPLEVSVISAHDLKSPLRHISNALEFLAEDLAGEKVDTGWLDMAREGTEQLQTLVDDILMHARGGHSRLCPRKLNLKEAVGVPIEALSTIIREEKAQIFLEDIAQETIEADPVLFRILMQNLLENALKYRAPDRPSEISIASGANACGGTWISVSDTGIGFPRESSEEIFEPFRQLGDKVMKGSGIGLATCKTICERHGWQINAEGSPGVGARFHIDIPG